MMESNVDSENQVLIPIVRDSDVSGTSSTSNDGEYITDKALRKKKRNERRRASAEYLFKYIALCQALLYIEAGAIPCILDQLSQHADMTAEQQGALGGIVYLALSAASPAVGYLFKTFDIKTVIGFSLIANNLFVLGFALTPMGLPYSGTLLIIARALIGFTQACICVYSPLWVDEYAPQAKLAGWMSYLQGSVPFGIMFGYFVGALSNGFTSGACYFMLCWRLPFLIQFLVVCPLMIGIFFVPSKHLTIHGYKRQSAKDQGVIPAQVENVHPGHNRNRSLVEFMHQQHRPLLVLDEHSNLRRTYIGYNFDDDLNIPQKSAIGASYMVPRPRWDSFNVRDFDDEENTSFHVESAYGTTAHEDDRRSSITFSEAESHFVEIPSLIEGIGMLLKIPVYVFLVLTLTSIYFVVTGVQYWGTIFMIKSLHGTRYLVNVLFVVVAGTGPITGVFCGGWLIDQLGGYKGAVQRASALGICVYLGGIAAVIAIITPLMDNLYVVAVLLWTLLAFGGSIVPSCTGMFISVVPRHLRALASSFSVMIFNLLGYSLSPYLTGVVMNVVLSNYQVKGSYFEDCDEACAYRFGLKFCLYWSLLSFITISLAYIFARRESRLESSIFARFGN